MKWTHHYKRSSVKKATPSVEEDIPEPKMRQRGKYSTEK